MPPYLNKNRKMKKLIFIITLIAVAVSASAVTTIARTLKLNPNTYLFEYTGLASDTLGLVNTTWSYEVNTNKVDGYFYDFRVKVADGTAGAATIKLQTKAFATDTYADITTVTWTGVGSTDTIAPFTQITTKVYKRYVRILVTRTGGTAKVVYVKAILRKN